MANASTLPLLLTGKLLLSVLVGYALIYPFLQPEPVGIAKELAMLGLAGALGVAAVFFAAVVWYAADLRAVLQLIAPGQRAAAPNSVWWMLVLPYNFIEDFFIIAAVTRSLRQMAAVTPALQQLAGFGAGTGFGWCAAQLGSLLPNQAGSGFAIIALVCWLLHWRFIRQAKRLLQSL